MNIFAKIATAAVGALAAVGLSAASAAVDVSSQNGSTVLDVNNSILIENIDLTPGFFMDAGTFEVGADIGQGFGAFDVRFSGGFPAGILDMKVKFTSLAGVQEFTVTDDMTGDQILELFNLVFIPGETVSFTVSGVVFETLGEQANYNIVIVAQPVPLPAAGVFLLTGLAGAAGLRLRKKAA